MGIDPNLIHALWIVDFFVYTYLSTEALALFFVSSDMLLMSGCVAGLEATVIVPFT